jgi:hypothetical protein
MKSDWFTVYIKVMHYHGEVVPSKYKNHNIVTFYHRLEDASHLTHISVIV